MSPIVNREQFALFDPEAKKRGWNYRHKSGFIKVTRYDSSKEQFITSFPDYMGEVLGRKQVRGASQKIVNVLFREGIREYNLRIATKRKVIAYTLIATCDDEIDGKPFTLDQLNFYGDNTRNVTGLALWVVVCWETKANGGVKYFDLNGKAVSTPTYRTPVETIDYTREREDFFINFRHQIALLVFNAKEFLSQTDKLLEIIDSGRLLPFLDQQEGRQT